MMGWEAPLMEQHARVICGPGGGHYLNVGFGLGIIDSCIQVSGNHCGTQAYLHKPQPGCVSAQQQQQQLVRASASSNQMQR
jgi:hypothetical protein